MSCVRHEFLKWRLSVFRKRRLGAYDWIGAVGEKSEGQVVCGAIRAALHRGRVEGCQAEEQAQDVPEGRGPVQATVCPSQSIQ